jgi:hypothetical protein
MKYYNILLKKCSSKGMQEKPNLDGFVKLDDPYSHYMISSKGEIYSIKRNLSMNGSKSSSGYNTIFLRNKSNENGYKICDLVAKYFLPKVKGKNHILHKNKNITDDRVENLQWVTEEELRIFRDGINIDKLKGDYIEKGFKIMNPPFDKFAINKSGEIHNLANNTKMCFRNKEKKGYFVTLLGTDKISREKSVHNLVAEYFLDGVKKDMVWQKDKDKFNVHVDNLMWATNKEYQDLRNNKVKDIAEEKGELQGYIRMNKPYDGYYINKKGEIYSLHKKKILNYRFNKEDEYYYMKLYYGNDKCNDFKVHNLVAEYYLQKVEGKEWIWHKDGDYSNNNIDNLIWVNDNELFDYRLKKQKEIMLNGELKDYVEIKDQGGYYYINKEGKIYSFYKNMFVNSFVDNIGYLSVGLVSGMHKVHRLVALAFIPTIQGKDLVNHKDGNKKNCHMDNLEWVNYSENAKHAHKTGLHPKIKNVNEYIYYQLDEYGDIIDTFRSLSELSKKIGEEHYKKIRIFINSNDNNKFLGYYWIREKINHDIYDDEIWKKINVGNELDKYIEVSNYARVRNTKNSHYYAVNKAKDGKYFHVSIKIKKNRESTNYSYPIHRLVALSFLENKYGLGAHVDHIDKNPANNHLSNLQWLSVKEHVKKDKGISVTEVKDNGDIIVYDTLTEAAKENKVNAGQISEAIKKGKKYRDSYWYRTSDYSEELHLDRIKTIDIKKKKIENTKPKTKKLVLSKKVGNSDTDTD